MIRGRRALRLLFAVTLAGAAGPGVDLVGDRLPAAGAFPGATVELAGQGYGHGRGMGQFGSLGYALQGWGYERILDHFYGGTSMGNLAEPEVTVELTRLTGVDVIVAQERGHLTTAGAPGGPSAPCGPSASAPTCSGSRKATTAPVARRAGGRWCPRRRGRSCSPPRSAARTAPRWSRCASPGRRGRGAGSGARSRRGTGTGSPGV
jgi:Sporulation protein and related proteins